MCVRDPPVGGDRDQVGEGAADVDADAQASWRPSATCHCEAPQRRERSPLTSRVPPGGDCFVASLLAMTVSRPRRSPADRRAPPRRSRAPRLRSSPAHRADPSPPASGRAVQRIAPAAGAGQFVAEHLAAPQRHRELGVQHLLRSASPGRARCARARPAPPPCRPYGRCVCRSARTCRIALVGQHAPGLALRHAAAELSRRRRCPARIRSPALRAGSPPRSPRPRSSPCWRTCRCCRPARPPTAAPPQPPDRKST